jgi:hypothetical protein
MPSRTRPQMRAVRRRPARPGWLWLFLALDASAAGIGLYLLRPHRVCSGIPPSCVDLNPRWGLFRFLVILAAAVIASILFALARVEEVRREESLGDATGRTEGP